MLFSTYSGRCWLISIAIVATIFARMARSEDPDAAPYLAAERHAHVRVRALGAGAERAYVVLPDQPEVQWAPLVILLHGWLGMNPKNFGALIDHLARRGAVVVYPVYQDGERTAPQAVTALAARGINDALAWLAAERPNAVDAAKTLYWGYSLGAAIASSFAVAPEIYGVPEARALVMVAPGDAKHVATGDRAASIYAPVEELAAHLPTLLITGAQDSEIGLPTSRALAARLCHIAADRRALLVLRGDPNAAQPVAAKHGSPGAPDSRYDFPDSNAPVDLTLARRGDFEPSASLNHLDFRGYWRVTVSLMDWLGSDRGGTEPFRDLPLPPDMGHDRERPRPEAIVEPICERKESSG